MSIYKCLHQQIYTNGDSKLVPIRYKDRGNIMKWRNEQMYHLRQTRPLTSDDQESYFTSIVSKLFEQEKPAQILFSYMQREECIGYGGLVHINWIDCNAEISFIMATQFEKEHFSEYWSHFLCLLEKIAFGELKLHKIYTYAFDLRPHLYTTLEANGYLREATLKEHCLFEGEYKNVVIHSKINYYD